MAKKVKYDPAFPKSVFVVEALATDSKWFPLLGVPVSWHRDEAQVHAKYQHENLGFKMRVTEYVRKPKRAQVSTTPKKVKS